MLFLSISISADCNRYISSLLGCGIARGYPVGHEVSSHVGVSDPQPSDQLYSQQSFKAETDSDGGKMKNTNHIDFASSQVQRENGDNAGSVDDLSDQTGPKSSSVQRSNHEKSTYLHPLPLLVKQTRKESIQELSFPSVQHFKQFVETMKNSYLTPGNDVTGYFQMARHVLENELASNAQEIDDPTTDYRSSSSNPDEIWSESMNSVESEHGAQFPDPALSTLPSRFDENQDSDLNRELPRLAADGHVSKGYGSLDTVHLSNGLENAAGAQNKHTYPVSHRPTDKMPSVFGDLPSAEALISLARGPVPELDSKTSERMSQESDSEDLLKYESPSGGFQLGGFQKKDLRVKIPADVLYSPHIGHKNNQNVPERLETHRESLHSSSRTHQSILADEESNGVHHSTVHLPSFGSSGSSNTDRTPQGRRGQVGAQLGSPRDPEYEAFDRRQPPRSQHGERNTIFGINELKQMTDDLQAFTSGGLDSARWISSPYKVDYSLNFLANLALPYASDPIFWSKTGYKLNSRNSNMKNIMSDNPNMSSSFFTPRRRGVTLQGGFVGPADTIRWPPRTSYAFRGAVNGAFQRKSGERRGLYSQAGAGISLPFYTTKTRRNYFRSKVSRLKSHYAPHERNLHETGHRRQKPAPKYPHEKKAWQNDVLFSF